MGVDLQKAYNITKKEFGKRRYKIDNSMDKIKNNCIMIELSEYDSLILYSHDKNWNNVDEILDTCHHGNRFHDKCDDNINVCPILLDLYSYGLDGSEDEAFYLY